MKKLLLAAICCVPGLAFADDAAKPADQMAPPKPGAEQKALAPFFGGNMTWAGTMHAGAMGPSSPEMPTKGKQTCHVGLDGFWYMCEASSTTGSGKQAMKWSGHFLIGYDAGAKSYRATGVDNMGFMVTMKGELNGKKFTLVSEAPMTMMGTRDPAEGAYTVHTFELGVNAWGTKHVRLTCNYLFNYFDGDAANIKSNFYFNTKHMLEHELLFRLGIAI